MSSFFHLFYFYLKIINNKKYHKMKEYDIYNKSINIIDRNPFYKF